MLSSRPILFAAALALGVIASSRDAAAFCRSTTCECASQATCATDCPLNAEGCPEKGLDLSWSGACTGFALNVAGTSTLTADQWTEAIVEAFDAWTSVDCGGGRPPSIDLIQLRDVSCAQSGYNPSGPNVNAVYFDDNGWSGTGIDGTLAQTTVTYSNTGQILSADIAINSAKNNFTVTDSNVQTDLVSVITHEVGHFLGVAHSPLANAVMFADYTPGTIKRTLTPDDIAAVCAIYPPNRDAGTCDPIPPGGLASTCDYNQSGGCSITNKENDGGPGVAAAFALMGLIGLRSRARRRAGSFSTHI
jgi:MYXO-CTERM domain-containing protein